MKEGVIIILKNIFNTFFANFGYILFMVLIFIALPIFLGFISFYNGNVGLLYFNAIFIYISLIFLQFKFIERFSRESFGNKIFKYILITLVFNFVTNILEGILTKISSIFGLLTIIISAIYFTYFVILINYKGKDKSFSNIFSELKLVVKEKWVKYIKYTAIMSIIIALIIFAILFVWYTIFGGMELVGTGVVMFVLFILLVIAMVILITVFVPMNIILIQFLVNEYNSEKEIVEIEE